jgi:hypothetical protein
MYDLGIEKEETMPDTHYWGQTPYKMPGGGLKKLPAIGAILGVWH